MSFMLLLLQWMLWPLRRGAGGCCWRVLRVLRLLRLQLQARCLLLLLLPPLPGLLHQGLRAKLGAAGDETNLCLRAHILQQSHLEQIHLGQRRLRKSHSQQRWTNLRQCH